MKKALLSGIILSTQFIGHSQDFTGYRSGNYTGVNGVFYNPAYIADSRYRSDWNLFSASTFAGNNKVSFKIKNFIEAPTSDEWKEKIIGKNAGPSSSLVSMDLHGPSLMFNTGKKSAIALTTRLRTMANIIDLDGKLAKQLYDDAEGEAGLPYTIASDNNMRIAANAWMEAGISYSRVLYDNQKHFIKGGITLKYLGGAANGYLNINKLKGTLNEDDATGDIYLANTTGQIESGFGGIGISDFEILDGLNISSKGLGADIGFIYEFRPDHEKYKHDEHNTSKDRNKYKWKVGVAILDVGKIKYVADPSRSGAYDIHVTGGERLYLNEFNDMDIDDYNSFFKSRPQYFTPVKAGEINTYKISLPSTMQLNLDYHLHRGWYVGMDGQLPLSTGNQNPGNPRYYTSFTLTPRYEGRGVGFYLPINHNALTGFNTGAALRLGPLFLGSGSLLTAAIGQSKQADFYVGLRFGGLQKDLLKKQNREEKKQAKKEEKRLKKENAKKAE